MTIKFEVKYEAGHSYMEEWEKTDLFCPSCGGHEVWHDTGAGDYYANETIMCLSCQVVFHLYSWPYQDEKDWQNKQRFEALSPQVSATS